MAKTNKVIGKAGTASKLNDVLSDAIALRQKVDKLMDELPNYSEHDLELRRIVYPLPLRLAPIETLLHNAIKLETGR
jgi:hypothetical protein